jgi:hypothetical protein
VLLCVVVAFARGVAPAQQAIAPANRDPLMQQMLSQPKIDLVSPVRAVASFDPPVVAPGQQSIYRVTLSGLEASTEWPSKLTAPAGLRLEAGAHGEILRLMNQRFQPFTTFNYHARATNDGEFTVPEFTVTVYGKPVVVPPATLRVTGNSDSALPPATRLSFELAATNLYVGETVRARVILPSPSPTVMQGLAQVQFTGDGFLVDQGASRQRIEMGPNNGGRAINYVYEANLTPVAAGDLRLFAQAFNTGQHFGGVVVGNGSVSLGPPDYTLLESQPISITVRPIPEEGKLPGFTGAIGNLALGPPLLSSTAVRVGEPLNLTVTVTNRGEGPLARLVAPKAPKLSDWQVYEATSPGPAQAMQTPAAGLVGVTTFVYALVPLSDRTQATPVIPFSYFDPKTGRYMDVSIPSIPISVEAGSGPAEPSVFREADGSGRGGEKEPELSALAAVPGGGASSLIPFQNRVWFPAIQFAPALVLAGLLVWDGRRRYFREHPEVLIRRRARKALRRDWQEARRAAGRQDAPAFAAAAVRAMRAGSAPHYPADPRALVGRDVLAVLPGLAGAAAEPVRRFFDAVDASQFSANAGDLRELLRFEPELDQVLEALEAKL